MISPAPTRRAHPRRRRRLDLVGADRFGPFIPARAEQAHRRVHRALRRSPLGAARRRQRPLARPAASGIGRRYLREAPAPRSSAAESLRRRRESFVAERSLRKRPSGAPNLGAVARIAMISGRFVGARALRKPELMTMTHFTRFHALLLAGGLGLVAFVVTGCKSSNDSQGAGAGSTGGGSESSGRTTSGAGNGSAGGTGGGSTGNGGASSTGGGETGGTSPGRQPRRHRLGTSARTAAIAPSATAWPTHRTPAAATTSPARSATSAISGPTAPMETRAGSSPAATQWSCATARGASVTTGPTRTTRSATTPAIPLAPGRRRSPRVARRTQLGSSVRTGRAAPRRPSSSAVMVSAPCSLSMARMASTSGVSPSSPIMRNAPVSAHRRSHRGARRIIRSTITRATA